VGLSHELGVSQMTIRRDLQELDAHGFVRRIHGGPCPGAAAKSDGAAGPGTSAGECEPNALGMAVATSRREAVFLGSGTTTLAVAAELAAVPKHLTVFAMR
jgi:DeoR/GlpR family transcriptional regulator of sugar metabolism